ncbi:MAG: class I SAM-dependent methyltransferase [Candidatus Dormiibacterota bacterium]
MLQNRRAWDLRTAAHLESGFYDVASFKAGRNSLRPIEQEELGDVSGRSLLHLQCHFGMDTLSWARFGAHVTGGDFSEDAISHARTLAAEVGIDARFVCSNLYDLPDVLKGEFDIVVTTYGVLYWLPDLDGWAKVVAHFLKSGGTFCLVEVHPVVGLFDDVDAALKVSDSLFNRGPFEAVTDKTYADSLAPTSHVEHNWTWTVGEVVTSLAGSGLRIERLREYPMDVRQRLPSMVRSEDGYWRLPGNPVPCLYSVVATRPATSGR